jgi:hypothetical protein
MMVATSPIMVADPEIAQAASQLLGTKMEFQSISEYVTLVMPPGIEQASHPAHMRYVQYDEGVRQGSKSVPSIPNGISSTR